MSEVCITISKPLLDSQMRRIEKRYGFEVLIDEEPPQFERWRYFFGYDHSAYSEGDEGYDPDDEIFSPDMCQEACEWLEKQYPRLEGKVVMWPYQWGYRY